MLQQFTWSQFFYTAALLSVLWYVGLLFTAYQTEFFAFLKIRQSTLVGNSIPPVPHAAPEEMEEELMGRSKMPPGMEQISSSSLSFSDDLKQVGPHALLQDDQLGLVPDVLQELKEIFQVLAKEDGGKQDFFSLLELVKDKYGRISSNLNIYRINTYIRDHAPFAISPDELESLWD